MCIFREGQKRQLWQEWEKRVPTTFLVKHLIFFVTAQKNVHEPVAVSFLFAWLEYGSHIFATLTFLSGSSAPLPPWALSFHHRHRGNSRDASFLTALHISTLVAFVPELTRFFVCTPLNQLSSIQNLIRYSTLKQKQKQKPTRVTISSLGNTDLSILLNASDISGPWEEIENLPV